MIISVHDLKQGKNQFETISWVTFSCLTREDHCPEPQALETRDCPPGVTRMHFSQRSTWDKGYNSKTPKAKYLNTGTT